MIPEWQIMKNGVKYMLLYIFEKMSTGVCSLALCFGSTKQDINQVHIQYNLYLISYKTIKSVVHTLNKTRVFYNV